jgi:hypothetical protein
MKGECDQERREMKKKLTLAVSLESKISSTGGTKVVNVLKAVLEEKWSFNERW